MLSQLHRVVVRAVVVTAGLLSAIASGVSADTWLNETNTPGEADYCNLQFPFAITIDAGQSTGAVFGQLYEPGVTETPGANPNVVAQLGFGPQLSDPRVTPWQWFATSYNAQSGNNDEYVGSFIANTPASYSYTFRYSLDNAASWTLGDINGAGSIAGLTFETTQLGALTVTPEPASIAIVALGALTLLRRVR
jgi:hypothetical protein